MYFNVLPAETKKSLKNEYHLRLATVSLFAVAVVFGITAISLVPSLILVSTKEQHEIVRYEILQKLKAENSSVAAILEINSTQTKLVAIEQADAPYLPSDLIEKVYAVRPSNVDITSVSLSSAPLGKSIISISGVAATRGDLVNFESSLGKTEPFTKVDLPISTLAKSSALTFTISVSGNF